MNVLRSIFILSIFCISVNAQAQRISDLGIVYGSSDLYRLNLEFRKPIKEKYRLKLGYSQGFYSSYPNNYDNKITFVSDSLIINRNYNENSFQFTLKVGLERQIKESMFSFGADVLMGYNSLTDGYYDTKNELIDSVWSQATFLTEASFNDDPTRSSRKTNYFVPGLQLNFSMDIPIANRLFLHLFYGQIITMPIFISQKIIQDPLNELQSPKNAFMINSQNQVGIGVRYSFKK